MAGFGREPFGYHPFGHSNFGADTLIRVFPKSTLALDTDNLLQHYFITIQNSTNTRKQEIDNLMDLVNVDAIRSDLIKNLGEMIGIGLDENEGIEFQRTLVRDAVQYYQVKGNEKSFKIRGKISGFDVEVFKIWKVAAYYLPYLPAEHILEYPPGSGSVSGIWYTDISPQSVSGVSAEIPINGDCDYCLTSYIKVGYTLVKQPSGPIVGNLLDRVIEKIKDVIPIHVRDVFVELTINIGADVTFSAGMTSNEENNFLGSVVDRFDIIPADEIILDRHIPTFVNF